MKVTEKLTLEQYDRRTRGALKEKVPVWRSADHRRRLGDSIYDFSKKDPQQRNGVHVEANKKVDLSGKYVLLSSHFFYFGDAAPKLPASVRAIAANRQGHRRALNQPFLPAFERWIASLSLVPGTVAGEPLLDLFDDGSACRWCAAARADDDEEDSELLA